MAAPAIKVTVEHDLARLNQTLTRYAKETGKDLDKTNIRKATDISYKTQRMFARIRYRKAWTNFYGRSKKGIGTLIRAENPSAKAPTVSRKGGRKLSHHQRMIWTEITDRAQGSGIMAVAMQGFRRYGGRGFGLGRYYNYDRSRELGMLSLVSKDSSEIKIDLRPPGLRVVNARTNIIGMALRQVNADTDVYLKTINDKSRRKIMSRKVGQAFRRSWTLKVRRDFK